MLKNTINNFASIEIILIFVSVIKHFKTNEMKKLILNKEIKSKKFFLIFPKDTELSYFETNNEVFIEHPVLSNAFIKVSKEKIKSFIN